jgi:pyruvate dehydrogenase E2 component (dihydrolipoamide acetyltransferase)
MRFTVKMPRTNDAESVVNEWLVSEGTSVSAGDALASIETDKTLIEVPAPVAGTVVSLLVAVDETVSNGQPLCVIES